MESDGSAADDDVGERGRARSRSAPRRPARRGGTGESSTTWRKSVVERSARAPPPRGRPSPAGTSRAPPRARRQERPLLQHLHDARSRDEALDHEPHGPVGLLEHLVDGGHRARRGGGPAPGDPRTVASRWPKTPITRSPRTASSIRRTDASRPAARGSTACGKSTVSRRGRMESTSGTARSVGAHRAAEGSGVEFVGHGRPFSQNISIGESWPEAARTSASPVPRLAESGFCATSSRT